MNYATNARLSTLTQNPNISIGLIRNVRNRPVEYKSDK